MVKKKIKKTYAVKPARIKKAQTRLKAKHRYTWKPDLPDYRDYTFLSVQAPIRDLPSSVDLRDQCSPVVNQGQIGSCTGNALAGAFEFLELKELKEKQSAPEVFSSDFAPASRLFIYFNERALEGTTDEDAGGRLRDGVKAMASQGVCPESFWKYQVSNVLSQPNAKAYSEAAQHCISTYLKIQTVDEIKQCLFTGFPVAFGFSVYESFESPEVAKTGQMPLPEPGERMLGGHAVLAVGYDDSTENLIVRNSWGEEWGMKGYFFMPYAYIDKLRLAQDFWTIRK